MPTECVPMGMCATRYPVWMDGRLPANRNNAVVTGCINTGNLFSNFKANV